MRSSLFFRVQSWICIAIALFILIGNKLHGMWWLVFPMIAAYGIFRMLHWFAKNGEDGTITGRQMTMFNIWLLAAMAAFIALIKIASFLFFWGLMLSIGLIALKVWRDNHRFPRPGSLRS